MFSTTSLGSRLRGHHNQALFLTLATAYLPLAEATGWALSDDALVIADADLLSSATPDVQILTE